jgi:hypothetical protein
MKPHLIHAQLLGLLCLTFGAAAKDQVAKMPAVKDFQKGDYWEYKSTEVKRSGQANIIFNYTQKVVSAG